MHRGCTDEVWRILRLIQKAGPGRVTEYAWQHTGILDPWRDLDIVRRAAVTGYAGAAAHCGLSWSRVRFIVKRYGEIARKLLEQTAQEGGAQNGNSD